MILKASLEVVTNLSHTFSIPVQAYFTNPTIVAEQIIFPLTQVGTTTALPISIQNPTDLPLQIQLLPIVDETQDSFFLPQECHQIQILEPHAVREVGTLNFSPTSPQHFRTSLYIKNNLTIIDSIPVFAYVKKKKKHIFFQRTNIFVFKREDLEI